MGDVNADAQGGREGGDGGGERPSLFPLPQPPPGFAPPSGCFVAKKDAVCSTTVDVRAVLARVGDATTTAEASARWLIVMPSYTLAELAAMTFEGDAIPRLAGQASVAEVREVMASSMVCKAAEWYRARV